MKFDHLILRKIIKFVATRCKILRLKCTNFHCSAPQTPVAGLMGPTSKQRGKERGENGERKEGGGMSHLYKGDKRPGTLVPVSGR